MKLAVIKLTKNDRFYIRMVFEMAQAKKSDKNNLFQNRSCHTSLTNYLITKTESHTWLACRNGDRELTNIARNKQDDREKKKTHEGIEAGAQWRKNELFCH